jgi:hypothetical protein
MAPVFLITFPIGTQFAHTRHYGHSALMESAIHTLPGFNISFTPLKKVESIRLLGAGKTVPISNMEAENLQLGLKESIFMMYF